VETNGTPSSAVNVWDAENAFYLHSHPSRLAKLLAHYELYQMVAGLPGSIVECGVFKGASLTRFATFRQLLENVDSRRIYGLDAFGSFPTASVESTADRKFIERFESDAGQGIDRDSLDAALRAKGFSNFELIRGDVFDTIPELLSTVPQLRIALLHLDLDVYEPTRFALDQFFPRMVPSGLVVFDDYGSVEGATRVADDLCRSRGLILQKLPFYSVPAYVKA